MNLLDIRAQIEEEITWRSDEIRFLKNQLSIIQKDTDKEKYRKSLIVMLYSHYEGFCKTVFQIYINEINKENLTRADANYFIATASLDDAFKYYENRDKKNAYFKNPLPHDEKLHKFSRQVDFLQLVDDIWSQKLVIPEKIVDTEANLKPIVLRKLLFRLGFNHTCFATYEGLIDQLLNKRNNVAHGSHKEGIKETDYEKIETATFKVMDELKKLIMDALSQKLYLKQTN
jgi:hypothetical protein